MGVKGRKEIIPQQIPVIKQQSVHSKLVDIAYKWVLKNASCGIAFKELVTGASYEIPDVIGFSSGGISVLIEVKISRQDFLCDKKKLFRITTEYGMGTYRFYCCPEYLISQDELPTNWGLIYVNDKNKARCIYNPMKDCGEYIQPDAQKGERYGRWTKDCKFEKNIIAEHSLMYSALRRLHLRGRLSEIYEQLEQQRNDKGQI